MIGIISMQPHRHYNDLVYSKSPLLAMSGLDMNYRKTRDKM